MTDRIKAYKPEALQALGAKPAGWQSQAACSGLPSEWFIDPPPPWRIRRGGGLSREEIRALEIHEKQVEENFEQGLAICRGASSGAPCPVRLACLEYACMDPAEEDGVWGGLVASDREIVRELVRGGDSYEEAVKVVETWEPDAIVRLRKSLEEVRKIGKEDV